MNASIQEWVSFASKPSNSEVLESWVSLSDVESFLQRSVNREEIVLQALCGHMFFHTVVVPQERLDLFPPAERLNWEIQTDACWGVELRFSSPQSMRVAEPIEDGGSPFYAKAEQIVFSRSFEGRIGDKHYYELLQKFSQTAEIHYIEERNAWCRLDKNGDIAEVVKITSITGKGDEFGGHFVTVKRKTLDNYLILTGAVAVRVFDITRIASTFGGWREGEAVCERRRPTGADRE